MHRPIFGHSFAVLVAPILLSVLAFKFLNKKKASSLGNAEDSDTDTPGSSSTPMGTNSSGSSSTPPETASGASISSTTPYGDCYEVFLSFSGRDTRDGFTDHLYHGLIDARIHTFRDNEELRRGKKIGDDLFAAIKKSKILIPILSVNYGTSSWCLNELVQIMECKKKNKETIVLPIFYKVEPSDVGHLLGSFGDEFRKREERLRERTGFDPTILEKWKEALEEVCSLKGHSATGPEGELVKSVVREVLSELITKFELDIPENLIGIGSDVEEVVTFVANNSRATLFVGIHGMGGIGKTTLAKTIYNQLLKEFEYHSFIDDISEKYKNGVEHLQNKLIHDILKKENLIHTKDEGIKLLSSKFKEKKVLILLDDVDADVHLEDLAGNREWFSSGSVIIITTRNESILKKVQVNYKHDHKELDKDKSLILFSRYAFRKDKPSSEFKKLTDEVVSTTGGLPLSLKVLGSFLCDKQPGVWEDTIKQLRKAPYKEVQQTLRISFEALEYEEKQIFLDIACFFIGTDLTIASYMWDACGFSPKKGIEVLKLMSLIKVEENQELRMHDQLRDFGRLIVREENMMEPGKRSRLWDSKEVVEVLEDDEGTGNIEALSLGECGKGRSYEAEKFKEMAILRFFQADRADFTGDFQPLFRKLRWLRWVGCPSDFAAANFHPKKLVVLDLSRSAISEDWGGWTPLKIATELKVLNLTKCQFLRRIPDLSTFESLEILVLRYCENLEEIHPSIGDIKTLISLDARGCIRLKELPTGIGRMAELRELRIDDTEIQEIPLSRGCLTRLETLSVSNCKRLSQLCESMDSLVSLTLLDVSRTKIEELPESIGSLKKLETLNASECTRLSGLPESMSYLVSLTLLDLSGSEIQELPESIGSMKQLKTLYASSCALLTRIPSSIGDPASLQRLSLDRCRSLTEIPDAIGKLTSLTELDLDYTSIAELPESIGNLQSLRILTIRGTDMTELPGAIGKLAKLEKLGASGCKNLEGLPSNLCELVSLKQLFLDGTGISGLPESVSKLSTLQLLSLGSCTKLGELPELPSGLTALTITCQSPSLPHLSQLTRLNKLTLSDCPWVEGLPELPLGLSELSIERCGKLKALTSISNLKHLSNLSFRECCDLTEIRGLEGSESLRFLFILGCTSLGQLPDLSNLKKLLVFCAQNCEDLVEIRGLDGLESLLRLEFYGCTSLGRILDLSNLKSLEILAVEDCPNVAEIRGLDGLECLNRVNIPGCRSVRQLRKMSKLKNVGNSNAPSTRT